MKIVAAAFALAMSSTAGAGTPLAISAADPSVQWAPCPSIFPAGCELTVLRGDPSKPNADVMLKVPGGYEFPAHSHTSGERMILVGGELTVRYKGHAKAVLKPGHYAFGPPGLAHKASCAAGTPCILFIAFEQPVDAIPFDGTLD